MRPPTPISLLTLPPRDIIISVFLPRCALQRLSPALPAGKPGAGAGLRVAGVGEMHFAASLKPTTEQNDLLSCRCPPMCSMQMSCPCPLPLRPLRAFCRFHHLLLAFSPAGGLGGILLLATLFPKVSSTHLLTWASPNPPALEWVFFPLPGLEPLSHPETQYSGYQAAYSAQ